MTFNINVFDSCYKKYTISFISIDDLFYSLDNPVTKFTIFFKNTYVDINISNPILMNKDTA